MLKVCGHYVLIRPDEVEEKSKEGIILGTPSEFKKESRARVIGTVEQIGQFAWSDDPEPWAEIGDKVVYSKYGGTFVTDPGSGVEYVVLNDIDIIVTITEGENDE